MTKTLDQFVKDNTNVGIDTDGALIPLTQGKFAIVDKDDFEWLNQWKWHIDVGGYAVRRPYIKGSGRKNQKCINVRMHRLINKTPEDKQTDHINRNKLDNRKKNLRTVTSRENLMNTGLFAHNTSGYKGVSWDKSRNKFVAQIKVNQKHIHLGRYINIQGAILARKWGERLYANT